ncbi:hypothetical protein DSOL_4942 [Desulfosporosinus metallidurans]|uniref:Uncharacterized protein n=1 Tax=Desulfosporosinus metallidurans TaxID=1888891 RepID=A0A1Q8QGP3_9FIRM|nr:hypothetical protein DSOL_4942 [Desulfosporosinus metallidurans]
MQQEVLRALLASPETRPYSPLKFLNSNSTRILVLVHFLANQFSLHILYDTMKKAF